MRWGVLMWMGWSYTGLDCGVNVGVGWRVHVGMGWMLWCTRVILSMACTRDQRGDDCAAARTERHVLQSRLAQLLIGGRKVEEIVDHLRKRNGSDHLCGTKTRTAAAFRSDLDGPQDHVQKGNRNETLVRGQPCNAAAPTYKATRRSGNHP